MRKFERVSQNQWESKFAEKISLSIWKKENENKRGHCALAECIAERVAKRLEKAVEKEFSFNSFVAPNEGESIRLDIWNSIRIFYS